ncbi:MAG TPA: hypothetical protein VFT62_07680 [Mycobacteriales bacterium]|nr:hypothetical protein [Mycobacteriales bacterium]
MPAVRRSNPRALVFELTRRLAEEYDTVPISSVTSAVRSAVSATELFGNDIAASLDVIEQLAREDLDAVRSARAEQVETALAS